MVSQMNDARALRARTTALLALGLAVLAIWVVQHPYGDIRHDAMIYSFLALARLHPDTLSNDVFLRFGSQDHFTLFSPIFSFMIRHFDLAAAAAIMTFVSQAALCGCAWLVARRFMSPASALLAVGLLLALPGFYGSGQLFSYTEDFLTARLPADALALGSLGGSADKRMKTALPDSGCAADSPDHRQRGRGHAGADLLRGATTQARGDDRRGLLLVALLGAVLMQKDRSRGSTRSGSLSSTIHALICSSATGPF